jgi:hypothetical protein
MASDKDVLMIVSLTGVDETTARTAFTEHGSLDAAIDALLPTPKVSGDSYIPPKPVLATGLDPEQEARCRKGRWLQDQVNAVFSVAQTQLKSQPEPLVPETEEGQTQQMTVPTTLSCPPAS